MKVLFTEKQRFNQWWVWAIIVVSTIVPLVIMYRELEAGGQPVDPYKFVINNLTLVVVLFLSVVLFLLLRLSTVVKSDTISIVYFPLVWKTIRLSDIADMEVINYGFVGGWGVRWFTQYGTVYNVRGNKGLYINLKNSKQLVIGTQKPEELQKAVEKLKAQKY